MLYDMMIFYLIYIIFYLFLIYEVGIYINDIRDRICTYIHVLRIYEYMKYMVYMGGCAA